VQRTRRAFAKSRGAVFRSSTGSSGSGSCGFGGYLSNANPCTPLHVLAGKAFGRHYLDCGGITHSFCVNNCERKRATIRRPKHSKGGWQGVGACCFARTSGHDGCNGRNRLRHGERSTQANVRTSPKGNICVCIRLVLLFPRFLKPAAGGKIIWGIYAYASALSCSSPDFSNLRRGGQDQRSMPRCMLRSVPLIRCHGARLSQVCAAAGWIVSLVWFGLVGSSFNASLGPHEGPERGAALRKPLLSA
jgi:hypothetical protein